MTYLQRERERRERREIERGERRERERRERERERRERDPHLLHLAFCARQNLQLLLLITVGRREKEKS